MSTLDDYLTAAPDLVFNGYCWEEGTCPSCGRPGFDVRLIDLRQSIGVICDQLIYEPWCNHCTPGEIEAAMLRQMESAKAA